MNSSFTFTESNTFTVTHARHMASKVKTDLKRMQRYYGKPSDADIADYEAELIELIKHGYLGTITYGYRRDGKWIEPTLKYTAQDLEGLSANDDDPGRIQPGANIDGAIFYNYLNYSNKWWGLAEGDQARFKDGLPFKRTSSDEPEVDGFFQSDKVYSSGGKSLNRSTVRSW